jgi:hypothetical protein
MKKVILLIHVVIVAALFRLGVGLNSDQTILVFLRNLGTFT